MSDSVYTRMIARAEREDAQAEAHALMARAAALRIEAMRAESRAELAYAEAYEAQAAVDDAAGAPHADFNRRQAERYRADGVPSAELMTLAVESRDRHLEWEKDCRAAARVLRRDAKAWRPLRLGEEVGR